jgi:Tol biopolymer transport system component
LLGACAGDIPRPLAGIDRLLEQAGSQGAPALAGRWLAVIGSRGGRDQVQLIDLETRGPVPLPGLNRPDAQPISVGVDASGQKLAVVRQIEGRTELLLYRRALMGTELIAMQPAGVPRRLQLSADGRQLALEVSRGGRWQVDLISVP